MKNKKQKQALLVFLFLAVVAGGVFGVHGTAHAGLWTVAADGLELVFKVLLYAVFVIFGWLLSVAVTIFGWAVDPQYVSGPTGFLNRQAIYDLWKFIRDFFNIFFIIVLLYTAFTIVFQVAKDYKKTLLHLVIMALLVNFSFPISRFLIDVANVPMYFFLNQTFTGSNSKEAFGTVLQASKIEGVLMTGREDGKASLAAAKQMELPHLISAVIFMFLFSISLLVLAVMFVVRLVALVILVIFSSVGFAASILPGFSKYASQWWDMFLKYAFFGPAAALMLLITVRFLSEIGHDTTFRNVQNVAMGAAAVGNQNFIASMAFFSIPIILLWFTIGMAQSFSIAGAGAVTAWGRKVGSWAWKAPMKATWGMTKLADRKIESWMAHTKGVKWLSPRVLTEAWKRRSKEQEENDMESIHVAAGRVQDKINAAVSATLHPIKSFKEGRGIDHTDHSFKEMEKQVAEERKKIADVNTSSNYVISQLQSAIATGNNAKAQAALELLAKDNNLNDMIIAIGGQFKDMDKNADGNVEVSTDNIRKAMQQIYEKTGVHNDETIAKQMMVVSDLAVNAGNVGLAGMAGYNVKDRKFKVNSGADQAATAAGKLKNLETQARQRTLHPDSLFSRSVDASGNEVFGDINGDTARAIIGTFTAADTRESHRSRDDLKAAVTNAFMKLQANPADPNFAQFKVEYNSNQLFRNYVQQMVDHTKGAGTGTSLGPGHTFP